MIHQLDWVVLIDWINHNVAFNSIGSFTILDSIGNTTTDSSNKLEVAMKLMKITPEPQFLEMLRYSRFKNEVRVYTDLKKG